MKQLFTILLIINSCSHSESGSRGVTNPSLNSTEVSNADSTDVPSLVPYGLNPQTPTQGDLIKVSKINNDSLEILNKTAYLNDSTFEGWAYQVFKDNDHRYRYIKYEKGKKVWQIGYFENGVLDHDFHVLNDKNKGSQRMWRGDGSPYIDNFFLEGGIMHGVQRRWYSDYRLAMESKYEKGILIYKKEYDKTGKLINEE